MAIRSNALMPTEVTAETLISGGVLTAAQEMVIVGAQSGTADDLDTVNPATGITFSGYVQRLYLTATIGDTITVKHNTGNILCNSGSDMTLTENKGVMLVRFINTTNAVANNKWRAFE